MLRSVEMVLATLAFVILTGTNAYCFLLSVPPAVTQEELEAYGGVIRNVFFLGYGIVALLALLHWKKMILGMAVVWPLMLMVAIAGISYIWSIDPEATSRRTLSLFVTTLMGIYLVVRFDFEDLIRFLMPAFGIVIIASLVWALALPEYGVHGEGAHGGAWRGIFFHKNNNGRAMVYALAVILTAAYCGYVSRPIAIVLGALAVLVLVGSTSKTSLIALIALVMGFTTAFMVRGAAVKSALITLAVLAIGWHVGLAVFFSYEAILEFLGRDPTLTGRTELWTFVLDLALERPFGGYGYEAFWSGEKSPGATLALEWGISDAHNGWIEIFVSLGAPIIVLIFLTLVTVVFRSVILARYHPDIGPALLIMMFIFPLMTIAMSESVFLVIHSIDWMMLVIVTGCGRALTSKLTSQVDVDPQAADADLAAIRGGAPSYR
ncbi:MAG: O-antigen ligase family protein [Geminicoccaceae bacterium]